MVDWLLPTLGSVVTLGAVGVTGKLALRTLTWHGLIVWMAVVYAVVLAALVVSGQVGLTLTGGTWWAIATAAFAIGSLVALYVALEVGDAGKVVPITAAYPAVTLILSALVLSEQVSVSAVAGLLLVIGGVVILTTAS